MAEDKEDRGHQEVLTPPPPVTVASAQQRVLLPPGMALDFGGIAKGWAAEQTALQLAHLGGVLVGFLLLACITPALTYIGVKPYWDKAIQGAVILLAVVADGLRNRKNGR